MYLTVRVSLLMPFFKEIQKKFKQETNGPQYPPSNNGGIDDSQKVTNEIVLLS